MFDSMEIVKRIRIQCIIKSITTVKLQKDLGLSHNYLSQSAAMKNGMSTRNLYAIAEYLGVSADYLLGLSDNPKILK